MTSRKVLWFINKVPLSVAQATGASSVRGGWLDSYIGLVANVADIDLTVAFPDWTRQTPEMRIDGVSFIGLPTAEPISRMGRVASRWRHNPAPAHMLAAARTLVRDVDPDLIHLHGAELCFGLAVRDSSVPTLLSIQGSPTAIRRLYLRGIDRYYVRSLSPMEFLKGLGFLHEHLTMAADAANEAVTMASVQHVAGRTEWDRRLASVMAPQAVYHLCDEPLRTPFYEASWRAESAEPARILCVSGHYALKGIGTLLRSVDIMRRLEPRTRLVLAGVLADTEHQRATLRHVRALGMEDNVMLIGEISAEALTDELTRAAVFVNPSHMENSSNTLSEAQLVGVPCVASAAGGMVTAADHGSAALLVQDGDAQALAGAVLSLANDPDEAARLGERGRVLAAARHDRWRIREQILSVYDQMLG